MCGRKLNSLFFADDGLLLARGIEEAKKSIKIMKEAAGEFGLDVNSSKRSACCTM